MSNIVYVSIGNSDDKLTQLEWYMFTADVVEILKNFAFKHHGEWFSLPNARKQNACWCVEFQHDDAAYAAQVELGRMATRYRQDSISWASAKVEFITGVAATIK